MPIIPESPVRIVVAGCGHMSHAWIEYALARSDCRIVGLVDLNLEAARLIAEKYQLTDALSGQDLAAVIQQTRAGLVFNLTIPAAHYAITMTAFREGCAVMSEKPLAANLAEADEMIAAASRNNLSFSVMQNRRYLRQIRALRQIVAEGAIGIPGYLGADFFLGPHFGGFRDLMDSPLLLDMAIHTFDQARLITGADAVTVYCQEFNPPGSWFRGNAMAIAVFTMSSGVVFCYRGSWCAVGCQTSWESDWRITGTQGTALWDGRSMPWAEVEQAAADASGRTLNRIQAPDIWQHQERHAGCLDDLFAALLSGQKAETDAISNRNSLAMVMAAIESARTGQRVSIGA